eukprot:m.27339 g.27339  ORF g.27339 m.27339 type:complete len:349 (-) comp15730_c0_seq1:234-1280(-)
MSVHNSRNALKKMLGRSNKSKHLAKSSVAGKKSVSSPKLSRSSTALSSTALSSSSPTLPIPDEQQTISLTFGDRAENHVGMQMIGTLAEEGFTLVDLQNAKANLVKMGVKESDIAIIRLHDNLPQQHVEKAHKDDEQGCCDAYVLIARNAIGHFFQNRNKTEEIDKVTSAADALFREQLALDVDKKAKMRGRVVNKHARWNVCYGAKSQEPDYEAGKGRVVGFDQVPLLKSVRDTVLPNVLGHKGQSMQGELNLYYDVTKCGIGFHGDSERKLVACLRLGASLPLHYQWFVQGSPIGDRVKLQINHGDFYVMSEKATGCDWKKRILPTLRHAAGCEKYLTITPKKPNA